VAEVVEWVVSVLLLAVIQADQAAAAHSFLAVVDQPAQERQDKAIPAEQVLFI
jgi:hypothetical protein